MIRWQQENADRLAGYHAYIAATGCEPDDYQTRPRITPEAERIMGMWGLLARLREVVDGGTILRMVGATREDLELLATVAEEVSKAPTCPSL